MQDMEGFLKNFRSKHTQVTYRAALTAFFTKFLKQDANAYVKKILDAKADRAHPEKYDEAQEQVKKDIESFVLSLQSKPPKTSATYTGTAKVFLIENGIELPSYFWRSINNRIGKKRPQTIDEVPTKDAEPLRKLFSYFDIRAKAFFLCLASSGCRTGELLQVEMEDIDLDRSPVRIILRKTKNGIPRHVYISSEAKEALLEYLRHREQYLASGQLKGSGLKKYWISKKGASSEGNQQSDFINKLFPLASSLPGKMWNIALGKAGLLKRDRITHRITLHPHGLRKRFRTLLGRVNVDMAEALMGHEGYLTGSYRRHSDDDLEKFFQENEHVLAVFNDGREVAKVKESLGRSVLEQKELIKKQQEVIEGLLSEKSLLQVQVTSTSDRLAKLDDRMAIYEKFLHKFMRMSPEELAECLTDFSVKKQEALDKEFNEKLKQEEEENAQLVRRVSASR